MAAPELVAITATILAPIAYFISTPKKEVIIGVMIIPPPRPKMLPTIPATTPSMSMQSVKVNKDIFLFYHFHSKESQLEGAKIFL